MPEERLNLGSYPAAVTQRGCSEPGKPEQQEHGLSLFWETCAMIYGCVLCELEPQNINRR